MVGSNNVMKYKTLSIVIPVYNEEKYIVKTLQAVLNADSLGLTKEIIVIDDNSTDKTLENIKKLSIPSLIVIIRKKNEGKGASLKEAILKTTGDVVLIQDADLEYSPTDYPRLLEPFVKHEADVVFGSRFISDRPHRVLYYWHSLANKFLTTLSNIFTNLNLTDMETGYKVFDGEILRKIAPKLQSKRFGFEPEITARLSKIKGISIYEVGISYTGRTYAEGKKIGWKDGIQALGAIVKYNLIHD